MKPTMTAFPAGSVVLEELSLRQREDDNRAYMMRLGSDSMLLNHRMEAGYPRAVIESLEVRHGGWEDPTCQLRGHFLGHWLSAAAMHYEATGDLEIKAKADAIVEDLANCQRENGGEWVGSIPEKYLHWIGKGKPVWAPHYTVHKTMMGLMDMYKMAGNALALEVLKNWSRWFLWYASGYTREEFDDLLDIETGGILEIWADLYEVTGDPEHLRLMEYYTRGRLFEPLLAGKDVLTNMHANTTIPEAMGAARCYEVTGDKKWLDIAKAYWKSAVDDRGQYATGGQTCGEIWTPLRELSARLGDRNQELCTVYNMMRLAEFLLRHTGEAKYADYWEMGLYNGILAQGHWRGRFDHGRPATTPKTGLMTYYLGLRAGSTKAWCSETQHFFCCHGALVQSNATHSKDIYYQTEGGVRIAQYVSSAAKIDRNGNGVAIRQEIDSLAGSTHRSSMSSGSQALDNLAQKYPHNPMRIAMRLQIKTDRPEQFAVEVRIPWWIKGQPTVEINGESQKVKGKPSSWLRIEREWSDDALYIELPRGISAWPLPDDESMVAFLDGPVLLAGLVDEERILYGDAKNPDSIVVPDCEREWANWCGTYKTRGQDRGFRLVPIHTIGYEPYTVYFPVKKK